MCQLNSGCEYYLYNLYYKIVMLVFALGYCESPFQPSLPRPTAGFFGVFFSNSFSSSPSLHFSYLCITTKKIKKHLPLPSLAALLIFPAGIGSSPPANVNWISRRKWKDGFCFWWQTELCNESKAHRDPVQRPMVLLFHSNANNIYFIMTC